MIRSLTIGLLIGVLGALISLMPGTSSWEESIGLDLLFKLRGQRPPPQQVLIVSMNGQTGAQLGLGDEIPTWPRSLYALLIDRLHLCPLNRHACRSGDRDRLEHFRHG